MTALRRRTVLAALLALAVCGPGVVLGADAPGSSAPGADLRVMSYNVRVGTAEDGIDDWDHRRDFMAEAILAFAPDLLGTQETLDFQRDFLATRLAAYDDFGMARDAAHDDGEMMTVFFRRDRFEKLDGGHFWLSETPELPGSRSWDAACPRMVTWVKLRDRRGPGAPPIVFLNTHFDHEGVKARLNAARILRERVDAFAAGGAAVIVTGDFNSGEDDEPHAVLFQPASGNASPVVDAYRVLHPARAADEGTFSNFLADGRSGKRIDWIGVTRDWHIVSAEIEHPVRDGRTPSDHFPVTAVLARTAR